MSEHSGSEIDVIVKRYASQEMVETFSQERRILLWRDLWIALAEAQRELGLPISKMQIDELRVHRNKINWKLAEKIENDIRHDVMAHVKTYAEQAPKAAPIIHLGATSAYVTDNADMIRMKDGFKIIQRKLAAAIDRLGIFALKEKDTATLAFTHFQPAQPTTVGKRACLWAQNFVMDMAQLEFELSEMRFQGVKGATGTQDSFLKLFEGDQRKVESLDKLVTQKMGFDKSFLVTGQTYPRKQDTRVLCVLASICESASKFANDMRLLQAIHEISEPRENSQVGSSAMPYKQNPMRTERICSLSRYVINLIGNAFETASVQWFERTLDDSANRRIVLPHAFLICDAVLDLVINVASGMKIHHEVVMTNLEKELPFLQTEEVLMAAVREGGNRQKLHEIIQKHSVEVVKNVREKGTQNDLLARLRKDSAFDQVSPRLLVKTDPLRLVGMASQQVTHFIKTAIDPIRKKYKQAIKTKSEIRV